MAGDVKGPLHVLADDLDRLFELAGVDEFLAKHAAFEAFCADRDRDC
jgi:hypothetical protein